MTTRTGIDHCKRRLLACTSLPDLIHRWGCIATEYQHNDEVQQVKEQMKAKLK